MSAPVPGGEDAGRVRRTALVVDDEPQLARALAINLRARGWDVVTAGDGHGALAAAARRPPDVVVLDLGLPDMDGVEVIEGLRGWSRVPIIVLSARQDSSDKVTALDAGADDYVTKPFGMDELIARLRAAVRRAAPADGETAVVVAAGSLAIDLARKKVSRDGVDVRLTPTEWHVLEVLVRNRGKLVEQRRLLQEVWGPAYGRETNYLRVYIAQLRHKLEADPSRPRHLITEPGMGYRFEVAADPSPAPG
jgi:two-component system KDP operon response regulator KdpE